MYVLYSSSAAHKTKANMRIIFTASFETQHLFFIYSQSLETRPANSFAKGKGKEKEKEKENFLRI